VICFLDRGQQVTSKRAANVSSKKLKAQQRNQIKKEIGTGASPIRVKKYDTTTQNGVNIG
jgi:hypothetical protein